MEDGKTLVKAKKYAKASRIFEKAYQIKSTKKAHAYSTQADMMADAVSDAKNYRFALAISSAKKAANQANGYHVLTSHARSLKKALEEVKANIDNEIKPLLTKARENEDNEEYDDALSDYQDVIDLPYINGKYYAKYLKLAQDGVKRVKKLALDNDEEDKQSSTDNKEDDQSTSENSSESSESSSSQSSVDNEIKNHHTGDHTVNGQTVQADTLSEIKKQLDSLGYNSSAWSPQDMINLYRSVNQDSQAKPSQITKDDVESYLKK
ncbi:lipoprotein [Lactobacillus hamsteri DSM 5661 = JCM 6256]|uniref:Lipoprotein n=2 Tax=Lactobacillus hamsteri TaxID=96565 RepID=A0A0R1YA13_9LACO|nr:lipoprotein [Lactobacillus hamsteri DSM 5661 = JCM 6256]